MDRYGPIDLGLPELFDVYIADEVDADKAKDTARIQKLKEEIRQLRHYHDTVVGLWVTDREDAINPMIKDKYFWRLKTLKEGEDE